MRIESWAYDGLFLIFTWLILIEGRKIFGREKANIFLWGSLLWTGIIENFNVIIGGYDYMAYANYYSFGGTLINGYGGWVAWILFVPLTACLGWFFLSFPALMISIQLLKDRNIWLKSTFAAIILVSFDVFFDPMAVVNEWWRWTMPAYHYRGVPIHNWIGWFFLLFFFGAIYERTVIQLKGFTFLSRTERMIFRTDTSDLSEMNIHRVGRVFYFRLIAFLPIFLIPVGILSATVTEVFGVNLYEPYNNVFPHSSEVREQHVIPPNDVTEIQQIPKHRIGVTEAVHKGNT